MTVLGKKLWTGISALALSCASFASASDYPAKPVRLVVPFAAGGSTDIIARMVADEWARVLKAPIVIDNRGGAGGNIGVDQVAKSTADGYTIGFQGVTLAINPALIPKMPYDTLRDLAPIGMVAGSQHVLVVNSAVPAKNLQEFLALVKKEPGMYSYGSAGAGSTFHMAAELFKSQSKTNIVHIPYRGGGPALVDTMSGQVQLSFPVLSAARPHIESGKIRALGVTGAARSPMMPDVPTIAQEGLPGYEFDGWFIAFAPAGVDPAIMQKLNTTLVQALKSPTLQERMRREGFDPTPGTMADADKRLRSQMTVWADLIKDQKITAE